MNASGIAHGRAHSQAFGATISQASQGRLALTANSSEFDGACEVGRACYVAADGRRAARALGQWCERFQLSEPEFQVLWCLRNAIGAGFDQTMLAKRLAYSPAQVSSTAERLRVRGWIAQQSTGGDRRRNLWHLSETGAEVVQQMLQTARDLRVEPEVSVMQRQVPGTGQGAAA
jgi:DNA-binding MarR family transcriptional regulator